MRFWLVVGAVGIGMSGCGTRSFGGEVDAPVEADGASDGALSSDVADGLPVPAPTRRESCPPTGSACAHGYTCTFGDPVEIPCREGVRCYHTWLGPGGVADFCSRVQGKPACPPAPPGDSGECPLESQVCAYPNGVDCVCIAGADAGLPAPSWRCQVRQNPPECPVVAPYEWSACSRNGLRCRFACYTYECVDLSPPRGNGAWVGPGSLSPCRF